MPSLPLTPADQKRRDELFAELVEIRGILHQDNLRALRFRSGELYDVLNHEYGVPREELAAATGIKQGTVDWVTAEYKHALKGSKDPRRLRDRRRRDAAAKRSNASG